MPIRFGQALDIAKQFHLPCDDILKAQVTQLLHHSTTTTNEELIDLFDAIHDKAWVLQCLVCDALASRREALQVKQLLEYALQTSQIAHDHDMAQHVQMILQRLATYNDMLLCVGDAFDSADFVAHVATTEMQQIVQRYMMRKDAAMVKVYIQ